jgi:hypothetical protein
MAEKRRVVVVGHRGVFGSLLVRELSRDFEVGGDVHGAYAVACADRFSDSIAGWCARR